MRLKRFNELAYVAGGQVILIHQVFQDLKRRQIRSLDGMVFLLVRFHQSAGPVVAA
jgi:tyrosine-protein phosphatase YwqE